MKSGIITTSILVLFATLSDPSSYAADLTVVKISPSDEKAVVRIDDGDLQIVQVGAVLTDIGRVTQIAAGRIVLEAEGDFGSELIIIRFRNGKQTIERIRKAGEKGTVLQSPQPSGNTEITNNFKSNFHSIRFIKSATSPPRLFISLRDRFHPLGFQTGG